MNLLLFIVLQPLFFTSSFEEGYVLSTEYAIEFSDKVWDDLLQKYVDSEGNVDYKGFKGEEAALTSYLDQLAGTAPTDSDSKEEKLAYYINLYNAATIKLILDNYPVQSIKDIKNPWDKKWIKVDDKLLSLGAIEHKILRKLNEPRIHFAINCASFSCPKLVNRAYTVDNLEQQLEQASRDFINDKKRNRIESEKVEISEIFRWFKSDFTAEGSLVDYINRYSNTPIPSGTKLQYINYDWSLNEIK